MSNHSPYFLFPDDNLETLKIWKEAGFCPPMPLVHLIETLHKSGESEIALSQLISEALFHTSGKTCPHPEKEYNIVDASRLKTIAQDYGITVKDRETIFIAQEFTRAILQDYGIYTDTSCQETDIQ